MQAPTPHPGSIQPGATSIRRQHGSMAIAMMLMLLGLISILGIVEVGYLYWAHRDAQKVADLAALSGAQQLPDCTAATTAASNNATTDNSFKGTPTVSCGAWGGAASPDSVTPTASSTAATNTGVKVVAQMPLTPFFGFAKFSGTNATAVAANTGQIAVFSVGTTLLNVNGSGTLPQLLQSIGINLNGTSLVSYQGLANVNITPAGLLQQLGIPVDAGISVGDFNALLDKSTVSAGQLLSAIVTLAGQKGLVDASATTLWGALGVSAATPGDVPLQATIPLGGPGGLFAQIVAPNAQAALNAQVNALQLFATAIGVGTGQHAITTDTSCGSLLALAGLNCTIATSVIEPPSIGIGGKGATAYTAQVRTFIHIYTPTSGIGIPLVGTIEINLPIAIDLVDAQATVTDLCDETDEEQRQLATIAVTSSLLKMCVGNITEHGAFSTAAGCDKIPGANSGTSPSMLDVTLLGGSLVANTPIVTSPFPANGSGSLYQGKTATLPKGGNPILLGATVTSLFTGLANGLINQLPLGPLLTGILTPLLNTLQSPLDLVGSQVLTPLLQNTLGLDLGQTDVHLMSLQCHNTQLVY